MALAAMSMMGSKVYRVALIVLIAILLCLIYVLNPETELKFVLPSGDKYYLPRRVRNLQQETSLKDDENQNIHAMERLCYDFDYGGFTFTESGRKHEISKKVTTCLIHSFSPYIEREAAKRFLDPAHDNIYYANSPAVMWFHGELVLVSRIWLDREIYEPKENWPANHFADNWLYTQKFDRHMKPVSNGSIIGIPAPKQWWVGDGPIEPRLFKFKDKLYVSFNSAMAFKQQYYMDFTVFWDLEESKPIIPNIKGGTPMVNATEKDDMPRDKHWMALIDNDELYFVHNLDPLRVMKCTTDGNCEFNYKDENRQHFIFEHSVSHLRGGTPFELWEYPYYISIAHATMYKEHNHHRYYTAHMVVLCVKPYRIVYVSNDIKIHPRIYQATPMVRHMYIDDGFIFPVGLIIENKDTMDIGVHVNDHSSVIIRMRGLEGLMRDIIQKDKIDNPEHGPPIGYLQTHIHDIMQNLTHTKFVHPKEQHKF